LANKAGVKYLIPEEIANLCCGTPFKSKGLKDAYNASVEATIESLIKATDGGRLPVVCENSSCSQGVLEAIRSRGASTLRIIDAVDFAADYLAPRLQINQKLDSVVLHPTCSSASLGSNANLEILANLISEKVTIPDDWGCCAFAGDRGMLHPELTASATAAEIASLRNEKFDAYLSTNLTCEIGMSRASGARYEHILCKLDQLTQTK
jgi:D-lactate dehydrogenase